MAFTWAALYSDGEIFPQYEHSSGVERSSERVDRSRLRSFMLYGHQGELILTQHYDPGQRMIYRRRTEVDSSGGVVVCHLVGWQRTVGDQNVQHVAYVFEADSRIVLGGKWRDGHRWFYEPRPVPAEEAEVQ